jgi:hypothetical protein
MFDGFKILLLNSLHILNNYAFEDISTTCKDMGVIHKTVYSYKGFSIYHYQESGTLIMHGSFHKYFNDGIHNYNCFFYQDFVKTVHDFLNVFSINPYNCILQNVEYGVNIAIKYEVNKVLDCLLFHENKTPLKPRETDIRFEHQQYKLKIYNKSEHYKHLTKQSNILRFEVRFERMVKLNNNGIYNLNDLLDLRCLSFFNNELLSHWNRILMYDYTINEKSIVIKQKALLKDYKNPQYWEHLMPNKRFRPKQKLKKIINDYSDNIQKVIYNDIGTLLNENV